MWDSRGTHFLRGTHFSISDRTSAIFSIHGKVYYLTQSVHGKKKFRFGFRFFYLTTDILNVNPDVFTLSYSREKNESMEDGNIGDEARYKMCV